MAEIKITFKKYNHTGRYASFEPDTWDIKYKRKVFGHISEAGYHRNVAFNERYSVSISVYKTAEELQVDSACDWKWLKFKQKFASGEDAKAWIQQNAAKIFEQFNIHFFED